MKATDHELGITRAMLEKAFEFNPVMGHFRRIIGNAVAARGSIAGFTRPDGYVQIKIKGRAILAHRLVWFDKADNRFENLRLADKSTNHRNNFIANKNNLSTGFRGVYFKKPRGTRKGYYYAKTRHRGKMYYLGAHKTAELAAAARNQFVLDRLPSTQGAINPLNATKTRVGH